MTSISCFTSGNSSPFLEIAMKAGVPGGIISIHGRLWASASRSMLPGRVVAVIKSRVGVS